MQQAAYAADGSGYPGNEHERTRLHLALARRLAGRRALAEAAAEQYLKALPAIDGNAERHTAAALFVLAGRALETVNAAAAADHLGPRCPSSSVTARPPRRTLP